MKIYVAAASAEIERAERMIAILRELGHEITVDWPAAMRALGMRALGKANAGLTPEQRTFHAAEDYRGVATAQRVVILVPKAPAATQGAWWEGGIADALEIPIIASGRFEDRQRNIFLARAIEVDTDDEVFALLRENDLLRILHERADELVALRAKLSRLESGVMNLMSRLYEPDAHLTDEERVTMLAKIEARIGKLATTPS
jgi:hypothetical protein